MEIGQNLRWFGDCEWVITATDPSKYEICNMQTNKFFHIELLAFFRGDFDLDKHVTLTIMHIENEPTYQKAAARAQNLTEPECITVVSVSL